MIKPVAIDLFCGLGGWTDGLMAEGYDVIGYDIERHVYGDHAYPAKLILADVRELSGADFKDASLIVASPPCQEYSYMAMPWTRAKQIKQALLGNGIFPSNYSGSRTVEKLNELFNVCFRLQREASEAAGKHIPLVVENVKGAQPWVGRAKWHYGSFYLWGDVPALMPIISPRTGYKSTGMNWTDRERKGQDFTRVAGAQAAIKNTGGSWFNIAHSKITGNNPVSRQGSSKSTQRKAASAMIAKTPFGLARHVARAWK